MLPGQRKTIKPDKPLSSRALAGSATTDAPPPSLQKPEFRINLFREIKRQINEMQFDDSKKKDDLMAIVGEIEQQVIKGDEASLTKLERWLNVLAKSSPKIHEITLAALSERSNGAPSRIRFFAQEMAEKDEQKEQGQP